MNQNSEKSEPQKKGGGDGKSKGAESMGQPAGTPNETSPAEGASDSGQKSREITTSRR